jgi:hypothetical protein
LGDRPDNLLTDLLGQERQIGRPQVAQGGRILDVLEQLCHRNKKKTND